MIGKSKIIRKPAILFLTLLIFITCLQFSAHASILPAGTKAPAFKVTSGDNLQMSLDMLQGRVIMLFYENKDVVEKNRKLKNTLLAFEKAQTSAKQNILVGLPVIDCSGAFFPFTGVWKQQLVQATKKEGLIIYGDWDGKVKSAYQAIDKDSNFFLIDQSGIIRYSLSGQADSNDINAVLKIIKQLLK